jgi:hypothetical protein
MNWSALLVYRDGLLYWKSPGPGRRLDRPAGSIRQDGYHAINVGKKKYRAHRIIWEMHHGPIPAGLVVDHIDADPGNNRIENLRLASVARCPLPEPYHLFYANKPPLTPSKSSLPTLPKALVWGMISGVEGSDWRVNCARPSRFSSEVL